MREKKIIYLFLIIFITTPFLSEGAEKLSLRFSYNLNSYNVGDVNTWINSFNELWQDYANLSNGNLDGEFVPLNYGNNIEYSLRIPIFEGFALNFGGGKIHSLGEGDISLRTISGDQDEAYYLKNETDALLLKIGFSYNLPLPFYPQLSVVTHFGRYIVFSHYTVSENLDQYFLSFGREFSYQTESESDYRSEALGFYGSLGLEFELIKYIAIVIEAEKLWATVDGYKGSFTSSSLINRDGDITQTSDSGKATLYFYEELPDPLSEYYSVLSGHKKRPNEDYIRNIRQGEFDYNGFSFKLGIRFKF